MVARLVWDQKVGGSSPPTPTKIMEKQTQENLNVHLPQIYEAVLTMFAVLMINVFLAIPFWLCWTKLGLGAKFFFFLPAVFQVISLVDCIGLVFTLMIISIFLKSFFYN